MTIRKAKIGCIDQPLPWGSTEVEYPRSKMAWRCDLASGWLRSFMWAAG